MVWTYDLVLDKLAQEDVYYHICDLIFTRVEWSQPVIFHFFKPRRNERVTNKSMIEAMYTTINMRKPRRQRRWTSAVDAVNTYSNGFLYISIVESITDILIEIFLICGKVIHIDRHKIWSMGNWSKNLKLLPPHFACFLVDMLLNILNIKNRKRRIKKISA